MSASEHPEGQFEDCCQRCAEEMPEKGHLCEAEYHIGGAWLCGDCFADALPSWIADNVPTPEEWQKVYDIIKGGRENE